jgi:hypothetical protein
MEGVAPPFIYGAGAATAAATKKERRNLENIRQK